MTEEPLYLAEYRTSETDKWMKVLRAIACTEGRLDEDRLKRLEEVLARAKTMDEALTGFKRLKIQSLSRLKRLCMKPI